MSTAVNPADIASIGLRLESFLKNKSWVFGPQFLLLPEKEWPVNPTDLGECLQNDPEVKGVIVNTVQLEGDMDVMTPFIQYFYSRIHLKRSVAWIFRFKKLL